MQPHRLDPAKEQPALLQSTAQHAQKYLGWLVDKLKEQASSFSFATADKKVRAEYIGLVADEFFDDQKYGHACLQYLTSLETNFDATVFLGAKNSFAKILSHLEPQRETAIFENGQIIELQYVYDRFFAICNRAFCMPEYKKDSDLQFECMHDILKAALILIKINKAHNQVHLKLFHSFQLNSIPNYNNAAKFQILLADLETRVHMLGSKSRGWHRPSFNGFY